MATRLTGAPVASKIYAQVREKAAALGTQPCLAAVSVGAQPDDRAYLRSIARSADGCGVAVRPVELPADCTADALTGTLRALSADDTVHGVLLLRPLPKALRAQHLLDALDPRKDVDGMTTASLGALLTGAAGFAPCTAEACLHLLRAYGFRSAAMALRDDSVRLDDPRLLAEKKLAVVMGTEGDGLAPQTIAACDYTVRIPMHHGVDSLNVAAASAVAFYQLGRRPD